MEIVYKMTKDSKLKHLLFQRLRILQWLPKYNRTWFFSDLIAGITVGLTMMPQSIAYASIADLPPHYGLYTAIMGSFVYIFFGTIKQVSIGPSSLMSLLTYSYVGGKGVDFIVLLSFLAGCVELLMGIFRLGFLVDFISAPVTSGFTSATSLIIILGQFKNIFGIKFKSKGILNLMKQLIFNIKDVKVYDATLGVSSMIFLLTVRQINTLKYKNKILGKAIWYFAICRNAIVVVVGSIIAFLFEYYTHDQPFAIAGKITPGLPPFKLPNFSTTVGNQTVGFIEMVETLGSSIVVLPIVAVLANVAIAKSFADGTVFDATQEMITLGISNIMGSFVGAVPTTGAFTRSAVNNASNVQTPLGGLYAGTMILLTLSFLTPYFYFIPKSTIAAVLICAVMFMIEYWELPRLWRCNKFDFLICITTFLSSLFIGVEGGLLVGISLNMVTLLKLWTRPKIFSEIRSNGKGNEYLLIKPELGLYFPAVNYFMEVILKLSSANPTMQLIFDLKNIVRVDYTACQTIVDMMKILKKQNHEIALLNVSPKVYKCLKSIADVDELRILNKIEDAYSALFEESKVTEKSEIPLLHNNRIIFNYEIGNSVRRPSMFDHEGNYIRRPSIFDNDGIDTNAVRRQSVYDNDIK